MTNYSWMSKIAKICSCKTWTREVIMEWTNDDCKNDLAVFKNKLTSHYFANFNIWVILIFLCLFLLHSKFTYVSITSVFNNSCNSTRQTNDHHLDEWYQFKMNLHYFFACYLRMQKSMGSKFKRIFYANQFNVIFDAHFSDLIQMNCKIDFL